MKRRNTRLVISQSLDHYRYAKDAGLVQNHIHFRTGKQLILDGGQKVTEFINCSYLGLDVHPDVVNAYHSVNTSLGVNFCCARSRLSENSLKILESELCDLFRGRAITFPTVTATHMSVMPLLASGALFDPILTPKVRLIFDRFAHASMQFLIPILSQECALSVIAHNDLEALEDEVISARRMGEVPVYIADGIYSMGGVCPIRELLEMADRLNFYLYIDDAHGTSIFGERGEGPVLAEIQGNLPRRLFLAFSMTKGFGTAGGGIVVSEKFQEELIRTYGMVYAFSAPLDFASTQAALAALKLHRNGTVARLQSKLRNKVALFDQCMGVDLPFSPIRMIKIGDERCTIRIAEELTKRGYFVVAAFFPVVAKGDAQLRICISTEHSDADIRGLTESLCSILAEECVVEEVS